MYISLPNHCNETGKACQIKLLHANGISLLPFRIFLGYCPNTLCFPVIHPAKDNKEGKADDIGPDVRNQSTESRYQEKYPMPPIQMTVQVPLQSKHKGQRTHDTRKE